MVKEENRSIIRNLKRLINGMPNWEDVIRGTLIKYYLTCGNKSCRCHRADKYKHGPYWYIAVTVKKGKSKMYKINNDRVTVVRDKITNYNKLWEGLCKISELNIYRIRKG